MLRISASLDSGQEIENIVIANCPPHAKKVLDFDSHVLAKMTDRLRGTINALFACEVVSWSVSDCVGGAAASDNVFQYEAIAAPPPLPAAKKQEPAMAREFLDFFEARHATQEDGDSKMEVSEDTKSFPPPSSLEPFGDSGFSFSAAPDAAASEKNPWSFDFPSTPGQPSLDIYSRYVPQRAHRKPRKK